MGLKPVLRLILVVGLSLPASLSQATPIQFADNGHYYEYISTPRNWFDARDDAASRVYLGLIGHLATITSEAENNFLRDTFGQVAWLGANDFDVEGTWVWAVGPEAGTIFWTGGATGGPFAGAYANFDVGEPNNQHGDENALHTWGSASGDGSSVGRWNDTPWQDTPGYYVEYSVPEPASGWLFLIIGTAALSLSRINRRSRACMKG